MSLSSPLSKLKISFASLATFLFMTGCNGCNPTQDDASKSNASSESSDAGSADGLTTETPTDAETAPESAGAEAGAPAPQGQTSCICACVGKKPGTETEEKLCKHFTMEKVKGETTYVCDTAYAMRVDGACENIPKSSDSKCSGFDPKTKAGPVDGALAECNPG
ncbi:MAG: hypothetical protein AB7T49_02915 [Oligoflexales bacterium]